MATSTIAVEKLGSRLAISGYVVSADHSAPHDVGWVDMQGYEAFGVRTTAFALTGTGLDEADGLTIVANSAFDGTGDEEVIRTHATVAPDAVGDSLWLEISAAQMNQIGRAADKALRYVSAKIHSNHAADDHFVTYVRGFGQFPRSGLTADVIA